MDKLKQINGYTLLEALFVLFILSVSSLLLYSKCFTNYQILSLKLEVNQLCEKINSLKMESYLKHERLNISFKYDSYIVNGKEFKYRNIKCISEADLSFNNKGNINKAYTLKFINNDYELDVVLYLGGGVYAIKEVKRYDSG